MKSSTQPQDQEKAQDTKLPNLGPLEEDDEFEDFAAEGKRSE
jgi:hypothetical protein